MNALAVQALPQLDPLRAVVERAQAGDREAREELAVRAEQMVRRVVSRRCGLRGHELDDATQEALLRVFRSLERFQPERAKFGTWCSTIAINYCRDRLRRRRDVVSLDGFFEAGGVLASGVRDPSADATFGELEAEIEERIERLAPPVRAVLQLRADHGMSYEQIADHLRVASGTVRSRLHRARVALGELEESAAA